MIKDETGSKRLCRHIRRVSRKAFAQQKGGREKVRW